MSAVTQTPRPAVSRSRMSLINGISRSWDVAQSKIFARFRCGTNTAVPGSRPELLRMVASSARELLMQFSSSQGPLFYKKDLLDL